MDDISTTTVSIPIHTLNRTNIDGIIKYKLLSMYENKCNSRGLILKDSIRIINRSIGRITTHNNESAISYDIIFASNVISPSAGEEYECYINSITKMGIIAFLKKTPDDTITDSPLLIIIPQDYIDSSTETMKQNQKIKIRVLDTRSKYRAEQIQVVAELITTL